MNMSDRSRYPTIQLRDASASRDEPFRCEPPCRRSNHTRHPVFGQLCLQGTASRCKAEIADVEPYFG